jgi:myo-inositol-1(or 4)-monophosphatase
MITEAGGLIGNFTGEADFLYQREVVAGNPRIYGQMVQMLAPFTHVIAAEAPTGSVPSVHASSTLAALTPEQALAASAETPAAAPAKKAPVRIRKTDATPKAGEGE